MESSGLLAFAVLLLAGGIAVALRNPALRAHAPDQLARLPVVGEWLPGDYRRTLSADCCKPAGSVRSPGCRTCMTSSGGMRGWFPGKRGARLAIWSLCLLLVVHLVMLSMDWREERGEEYRRLAGEWLKL